MTVKEWLLRKIIIITNERLHHMQNTIDDLNLALKAQGQAITDLQARVAAIPSAPDLAPAIAAVQANNALLATILPPPSPPPVPPA